MVEKTSDKLLGASIASAVGTDDANNEFSSTNVTANADGSMLERLEHLKSIVGTVSIPAVVGVLADRADHTTDTATMMKLIRWLDQNIGAFDGGADPQGSIYRALGVDTTNSIKALIDAVKAVSGALTDSAADTASTATIIALLRQIAEAVNNGTGTSIATNKSLVDYIGSASVSSLVARIGALTDVADKTTDTATIINLLRYLVSNDDSILAGSTKFARKSITFDGTTNKGEIGTITLFTVTGGVKVNVVGFCSADLVSDVSAGGATIAVGVAGLTTSIIATEIAEDIDANQPWIDATQAKVKAEPAMKYINGSNIIATVAVDEIVSGTIEFVCEYKTIGTGSGIVAA
jgi:hypothetical protein